MTTPHVHSAIIKAWADGATIQVLAGQAGWIDCKNNTPEWNLQNSYRVKPKPKPDVIRYARLDIDCHGTVTARGNYFTVDCHACDNLVVIFDGETGKLKSAEVV